MKTFHQRKNSNSRSSLLAHTGSHLTQPKQEREKFTNFQQKKGFRTEESNKTIVIQLRKGG